jgi:hypothetical protein
MSLNGHLQTAVVDQYSFTVCVVFLLYFLEVYIKIYGQMK